MFTMVKQSRNGEYLQVCQNYRDAGRVRQRLILYVGGYPSVDDALQAMPNEVKSLRAKATRASKAEADMPEFLKGAKVEEVGTLRQEADQKAERLERLRQLVEKNPEMVERDRARAIRRESGAEVRANRRELNRIKKAKHSKKRTAKGRYFEAALRALDERYVFPEYVKRFRKVRDEYEEARAVYEEKFDALDPDDFSEPAEYRTAQMKLYDKHLRPTERKCKAKALKIFDSLSEDEQVDFQGNFINYGLVFVFEASVTASPSVGQHTLLPCSEVVAAYTNELRLIRVLRSSRCYYHLETCVHAHKRVGPDVTRVAKHRIVSVSPREKHSIQGLSRGDLLL